MRWITSALIALIILAVVPVSALGQEKADLGAEFRAFFAALKESLLSGEVERIEPHIDAGRMWAEMRAILELEEFDPATDRSSLLWRVSPKNLGRSPGPEDVDLRRRLRLRTSGARDNQQKQNCPHPGTIRLQFSAGLIFPNGSTRGPK